MNRKTLTTILVVLGTVFLAVGAVFLAWKISRPDTTTEPEPTEASFGGGENCTLTFTVTEPDLKIKKYVKVKGTDAWYTDTETTLSNVTVGTLPVDPGTTVVWKIVLWNSGGEDISVSETTDDYTASEIYSSFAGAEPTGTGPTYQDWPSVIPAGGSEEEAFESTDLSREFEAVVLAEDPLLESAGAGSHLSQNTAYVTDYDLSDSASIRVGVEGESDLQIKKYVCEIDTSGECTTAWYSDTTSSLSEVEVGTLAVDPQSTVKWKLVVWNSRTADVEASSTDSYDQQDIYETFDGSSPDGAGPSFNWGTIPANGTEEESFADSNLYQTFTAVVKDNDSLIQDLGTNTYLSTNTGMLDQGGSDSASIEVTPSGEYALHIKKYVRQEGGERWYDDRTTVDIGSVVEWRVVVWNTGNVDAEDVRVSDVYTSSNIYQMFEGDSGLDGTVDEDLRFGTVPANSTEDDGVIVEFSSTLSSDLAEGSYSSVNTATLRENDQSDDAAIDVTIEGEQPVEEEEEEIEVPPTGGKETWITVLASVLLLVLGVTLIGF
ncbi:MAG: hypothetical protein U9M98_02495 [Patescibacteria group bacterium]|nr:hypothetical protein [Patescibacteria group bacterium]